jgi:squalene cyclase
VLQAGRSAVRVPDEVDFSIYVVLPARTMALGSTQPLTEMSTRNLPGVKSSRRLSLTTLPPSVSRMTENVGVSTSRNPKGLHGLYRDSCTLTLIMELRVSVSICVDVDWIKLAHDGIHWWVHVNAVTNQKSRSIS